MIYDERTERKEQILQAARQIMAAARTAPKGKGKDIIEICIITDEDIQRISDKLLDMAREMQLPFMERDAANVLRADAILLLGTATHCHGLDCGHCGFPCCSDKPDATPCALNTIDVGIAIGSAAATAADMRLDSRVMFSAGLAAQRLAILGDCRTVMAMPFSVSSKNPFFDR
ncbi:MAG: DUF2148 domain-containing protein [Tannerellaceae bacterium]|jgi:uncharacterized ferredoxin-like protein|nr:DUF2148 domain-containing protein [Tannerellaceae bacterium]